MAWTFSIFDSVVRLTVSIQRRTELMTVQMTSLTGTWVFSLLVLKLVLREIPKIFLNERVIEYCQLLKYPDKWIYIPKKKLNWRNWVFHDLWYSSRNLGRTWHLVSLQRQTYMASSHRTEHRVVRNPSHAVRTSLETWGGISFSELERSTCQAWHDHLKIPCVLLSQSMQKLSSYRPGRLVSDLLSQSW